MGYDKKTSATNKKKWGRRHAWDSWLIPGNEVVLTKGEHYNSRTDTMMQQIRHQATKRGIRVSVSCSEDACTILIVVWTPAEIEAQP